MTVFVKFIVPFVYLSLALGLFTFGVIMPVVVGVPIQWELALVSLLWGNLTILCCLDGMIPLKKVSVDGQFLRVSNFVKEIVIPLTNVEYVRHVRESRSNLIVISFKAPTKFGRQIKFIPAGPFTWRNEHPVFSELKELIESQRSSSIDSREDGDK